MDLSPLKIQLNAPVYYQNFQTLLQSLLQFLYNNNNGDHKTPNTDNDMRILISLSALWLEEWSWKVIFRISDAIKFSNVFKVTNINADTEYWIFQHTSPTTTERLPSSAIGDEQAKQAQ